MKTKWSFFSKGLVCLIIALWVVSCSDQSPFTSDQEIVQDRMPLKTTLTSAPDEICGFQSKYLLIAGQNDTVGELLVSNDNEYLYVIYKTNPGFVLTETHLYVGDISLMPKNKKGNPIIGHFPYYSESPEGLQQVVHQINLNDISPCFDIAAHAVVCSVDGNCETSWGTLNSEVVIAMKAFFNDRMFYGTTIGSLILPSCNSKFGYNIFDINTQNNASYDLLKWTYSTNLGRLNVQKVGTKLIFDVIPDGDYKVRDSYLYFGSLEGLNYLGADGTCALKMYPKFPYKSSMTEIINPHFEIDVTKYLAQKNLVGTDRWGWFISDHCLQYCN
jgi:hypothetical protein